MKISIANCFWLIIPALAWNAYFAPKLADTSLIVGGLPPQTLLLAETALRVAVFVAPVYLAMKLDGQAAL